MVVKEAGSSDAGPAHPLLGDGWEDLLTHYEALGIDRGTTSEEVRAAWKRAAQRTHTDRNPGADPSLFPAAAGAWSVLGDPEARRFYDNTTLRLMGPQCTRCKGAGRTWKQRGPLQRIPTACVECHGNGVMIGVQTTKP